MRLPECDVAIYEPIYQIGQTVSDLRFSSYSHLGNERFSSWREFKIHVDMFRANSHRKHIFCGLFSPKFSMKCRIGSDIFLDFCEKNMDSDVVFINPFPQLSYISFNVWEHAEVFHPGIIEVARNLLKVAGVDLSISTDQRHGQEVLAYSSFWCGSEKFWDLYVGGVLNKLALFIEQNPDNPVVKAALSDTYHYDPAPYLPFITERLFTTFLSQELSVKYAGFPVNPLDYCLNDYERDVVLRIYDEVDSADANNNFDKELIDKMRSSLLGLVKYNNDFYKKNLHPHTGRCFE